MKHKKAIATVFPVVPCSDHQDLKARCLWGRVEATSQSLVLAQIQSFFCHIKPSLGCSAAQETEALSQNWAMAETLKCAPRGNTAAGRVLQAGCYRLTALSTVLTSGFRTSLLRNLRTLRPLCPASWVSDGSGTTGAP